MIPLLRWSTRAPDLTTVTFSYEVEVTLRPTVSWPVRLDVLSLLEQVTRRYIYLSDKSFFFILHVGRLL
jgi:hypothetical protein